VSLVVVSLSDQPAADNQLARRAQDAERAPRHGEQAVIGVRDA
jgi:hypothetical protein